MLFAVWRWFDDRAAAPTPPANATAAAPVAPNVPLLSIRRVPALAERDLSVAAFRADLQPLVDEVSPIGCVAVAVDGMTVHGVNTDRPYIPASNQKLLTVAVALDVLSPDRTFTTEVARAAANGGVVTGDVYLVGGGDPVLQTTGYPGLPEPTIHPTNFDALGQQLVAAGITSITGNVVAVDSRYDEERYPPGWSEGIRSEEAGPIGALVVDDGIVGDAKAVDPARAAADELVRQLRAAGVTVGGSSRAAAAPADAPVLASVQSAPLSSIAADTLTNSDDNAAEMLLKELGTTVAVPGTRTNGAAVVQWTLGAWGIDTAGTTVSDGSGLDRTDLARCDEMLAVLEPRVGEPRVHRGVGHVGPDRHAARRARRPSARRRAARQDRLADRGEDVVRLRATRRRRSHRLRDAASTPTASATTTSRCGAASPTPWPRTRAARRSPSWRRSSGSLPNRCVPDPPKRRHSAHRSPRGMIGVCR